MGKSTLHIATRRPNGNIGYISEALEIPEFFDLIRPIGEKPLVLVDFSPVLTALHKLQSKAGDLAIRNQFNSLFNFWQDSKSYKNPAIRLAKSETLTERCNEFICSLQTRLQEKKTQFYAASNLSQRREVVQSIKQDADMYIVTLLCLIHAKASLEIESFREDAVITSYGEFVLNLASALYFHLVGGAPAANSFLRFLAFEWRDKLQDHLALLEPAESEDEFLLRTLNEQKPYTHQSQIDGQYYSSRAVTIFYDPFHADFVNMADILKDLMFRAHSVKTFIDRLKQANVSWDDSEEAIQALTQEVRYPDAGPANGYQLG
ncbi:hypothetical protein AB4Y45_32775 [Paraburkholderia sp. EG287A]|uniref:hypothetical protein n=1 Tax=Paraburkholderia sp. EG287A TaxID=3237012 RepID=UPI0034D23DF2